MDPSSTSNLHSTGPAAPRSRQHETQGFLTGTLQDATRSHQYSELQEPMPIIHAPKLNIQEQPPSALSVRRVSIQEPSSSTLSVRRVSIQEPSSSSLSVRRVSIQEPSSSSLSVRRVSIQEPSSSSLSVRRVSIQEPSSSALSARRVSIQEPSSSTLSARRVSIQEPSSSTLSARRVSIQGRSSSALSARRVSIQEPSSTTSSQRVSIHTSPHSIILPHNLGTQKLSSITGDQRPSLPDTLSVTYNRWLGSQEASSIYHHRHLSSLSSLTLNNDLPDIHSLQMDTESHPSTTLSPSFPRRHTRPSVDVPLSLTQSPEASIKSFESFPWKSKESLKEASQGSLSSQSTLGSFYNLPISPTLVDSSKFRSKHHSLSLVPIGWRLLLEARKISRQLSLVLTVTSIVIIGLISFGQPWIHFQVPLSSPDDPTGFRTIPVDTIFYTRCPDISCFNEYDKNAYLLDLAWACLLIAGVMSFCVCMGLMSTIFFPSTNLPLIDFSLFICSLMTGVSVILGVLFYLMQAWKYLQDGMTYSLGISFYLAWVTVFFFSMTGLFAYLNYMNFWSILAIRAIWS